MCFFSQHEHLCIFRGSGRQTAGNLYSGSSSRDHPKEENVKAMILPWVTFLLGLAVSRAEDNGTLKFPDGFKLGVATSAYQIEGAWNVSDKGENVWDHFTHEIPTRIIDGSNGDIAADSYHKYREDVAILRELGVDFYRLSLSWSRILPNGFANEISEDGIQYYKNLLDELIDKGIEPVVTLYHWDHPFILEDMGGWLNELMVTWFADYARVVFRELGDRVKIFSTINEPSVVCLHGFASGVKAPGKKYPAHAPYLCMHNMLKAHARVYRIYDAEFRASQGGEIGIVIPCGYFYPRYPNDTVTPEIQRDFDWGWTAHPIFSEDGDYPASMKRLIGENSELQGYPRSRLPEFTRAEIDEIRGSADYFGLNHYLSRLTEPTPETVVIEPDMWHRDSGVFTSLDPSWPRYKASPWISPVPQGFGDLLREIKTLYGNPRVYVMENGIGDDGTTRNDLTRIQYLHDYLRELLIAVNRDGCNVTMYAVWSLLDNMEWDNGYNEHFGIVSVDFKKSSRPRTPKSSFLWYRELIDTRELPPVDCCLPPDDWS